MKTYRCQICGQRRTPVKVCGECRALMRLLGDIHRHRPCATPEDQPRSGVGALRWQHRERELLGERE